MSNWNGVERRRWARLTVTEEQLEEIAERAAHLALQNFYLEVGKVTIRSCLYVAGAACVSAFAWLGVSGRLG